MADPGGQDPMRHVGEAAERRLIHTLSQWRSSFLFGAWRCDLLPCNEDAASALGWKRQVRGALVPRQSRKERGLWSDVLHP